MFNNNLSIAAIETETIRLKQDKEKKSQQEFLKYYEDGIICLNRGDYRHAIRNFEEALKIDRTNRSAQRYLIEAITANMARERRPPVRKPERDKKVPIGPRQMTRPMKMFVDKQGRFGPVGVKKAYKIPIPKPEITQEA